MIPVRGSLAIARAWISRVSQYRSEQMVRVLGVVLQIVMMHAVIVAAYKNHAGVSTTLSYVALANVQNLFMTSPEVNAILDRAIRSGDVAQYFARPLSLWWQLVANRVGATVVDLLYSPIAIVAAVLFGGLQAPKGWAAALLYPLTFVLAFGISVNLGLVVSLAAFWTRTTYGLQSLFYFTLTFLGGGMVPMWLLPGWLISVLSALPFESVLYTPAATYVGRNAGVHALHSVAVQVLWLMVTGILGVAVWRAARRQVEFYGG